MYFEHRREWEPVLPTIIMFYQASRLGYFHPFGGWVA